MLLDERLQVPDELGVPTGGEIRLDPTLEAHKAKLLKTGDLGLGESARTRTRRAAARARARALRRAYPLRAGVGSARGRALPLRPSARSLEPSSAHALSKLLPKL